MKSDDEFEPTAEEIAAEKEEEPLMMQNAHRWDHFLEYVNEVHLPLAPLVQGRYRRLSQDESTQSF
eukprot:3188764-Pleurochrysis_carterae.AAC.2